MATARPAVDKRRVILDAAVRVFARQGFHTCRVSDIADEAGVAYGLVYHYFQSKDEVLDTLFLERWNVMLEAIAKISEAYGQISGIVEQAQQRGEFRDNVSAQFAAMAFYGAIEQVLTGWIFGTLEQGDEAYDRAKDYVVETICDGLHA
jgi:TetR/AcrR family fatty acid metabolism transcriptional regulator